MDEANYKTTQWMVGREVWGAKSYFIFRPNLGIPNFENDYNAALDIPMKVLIYEREDKKSTVIRYRKPSSALADYRGLDSFVKQLDELMDKITDAAVK